MPETYKEYPIMELTICLQSQNSLVSGHERMQEGDIICVRKPNIGTGLGVPKLFLKLLVEGLELDEFNRLVEPIGSGRDANGEILLPFFDKRRFCIPLRKLDIDLDRARDPNDTYQPECQVDTDEPFYFLSFKVPLYAYGLIFDKLTGRYL